MSIDYDDAWGRAKDEVAFSNGTEGSCWTDNWCDRCARDAPFRNGITPTGCALLAVALMGRTPAEWMEQLWGQVKGRPEGETAPSLGDQYHCIEFRPVGGGGGGGEPRPRPEPPRMDGLFQRPNRAARMLVQGSGTSTVRRIETVRAMGGVL